MWEYVLENNLLFEVIKMTTEQKKARRQHETLHDTSLNLFFNIFFSMCHTYSLILSTHLFVLSVRDSLYTFFVAITAMKLIIFTKI